MLTIRLQRIGKTKKPTYRFVVSEKTRDPQAKSVEILGHYDPIRNPKVLEIKKDRVLYWIGNGAQLSNTVHNLLVKEGVIEGKKQKAIRISDKRRAKLDTKKSEAEAAQKAAKEAAEAKKAEEAAAKVAAAEAEKKAAEEAAAAPQEEAPAEVPVEEVKEETSESAPEAKDDAPAESASEEEKKETA